MLRFQKIGTISSRGSIYWKGFPRILSNKSRENGGVQRFMSNSNIPATVFHATLLKHFNSINSKILIHRNDAKHDLDFGKGFYTTSNYQQALERAILLQEKERYSNGALKREHRGIIITFEANLDLLYNVGSTERKVFQAKDREWAEYIVFNRVIRKPNHLHKYKWTYGSLADGKFVGYLCKQYFNREISVDQLIHGYHDGSSFIQGISPYSEEYDQLSFHEDEDFVNSALKLMNFEIVAQNDIAQRRR